MLLAQDPPDGGHGERDRMVSPEEEPEPRDPVLAILPDPETSASMCGGCETDSPGEPTGPADVAADLFMVLQHAEAGCRPLGSLTVPNRSPRPGAPLTSPNERVDSVRAIP